jgi:hypothetical protein
MTNLLAMAIVETDHVCRLMLTAYLTIFKTEAPVKIFKKEEEANRWLRQFLPA